ncbi:MAG: hypothetical protein LAO79_05365 [Acidobacteriia bacterium]|nr:hypothetical protein [Terriglobia bacterium]
MNRIPKWRVVACALAVMATLEICARVDDWLSFRAPLASRYGFELLYANDQLGRTGAPHAKFERFTLNSLGYLGPELRTGTIRIACIGASETFGTFNSEDKEYPRQLERLLNQAMETNSVQVVNASMPGNSLHNDLKRFPQLVDRVHPDIVVLYPSLAIFGWAVVEAKLQEQRKTRLQPAKTTGPPPRPSLARRVAGRLIRTPRAMIARVYVFLRYKLLAFSPTPPMLRLDRKSTDVWNRLEPRAVSALRFKASIRFEQWRTRTFFPHISDDAAPMFRKDLLAAIDVFESRGIRVVLASHANSITPSGDPFELLRWSTYYPYTNTAGLLELENRLNEVMAEVARERGALFIDTAHRIPKDPRLFGDFVHFNDEGAAVMAQLLAAELRPEIEKRLADRANR